MGHVGPASTRDDCADLASPPGGRGHERGGSAGAGPEVAQRQPAVAGLGPIQSDAVQPPGQKTDVEAQAAAGRSSTASSAGVSRSISKVARPAFCNSCGHEAVARAVPAAPAAVREQDDAMGTRRNHQVARDRSVPGRDRNRARLPPRRPGSSQLWLRIQCLQAWLAEQHVNTVGRSHQGLTAPERHPGRLPHRPPPRTGGTFGS